MMDKTSPRFFCSECLAARRVSFPGCLLVSCPLSLTVGRRVPPLPVPLVACLGVWRGGSAVSSFGAVWLVARRSLPVSVGGSACCLLAFLVSVFGEVGKAAFLVSALSAVG